MAKSQKVVKIYGTRGGGVLVTGATTVEVRGAMKAFFTKKARGSCTPETRKALMFYKVAQRFFKQGGRFKRPYKRKPKPAS